MKKVSANRVIDGDFDISFWPGDMVIIYHKGKWLDTYYREEFPEEMERAFELCFGKAV